MNYEETIDYLYQFAPMFQKIGSAAYKEGMENSFLIDKHLNHPHNNYKTIHIGGTNGKGSTSHLLASILQEAGYKTGLYTSPHLLDFRERIKVNGKMIDKNFIVDFIENNKTFFESIQPSFFELTTGMAFAWFAEQKVDVAVIEVGLGGRLDCTNVITPVLSIITNISFDHTQLLGNTLTAIAREKAGIIKDGVPVIIGEAGGEVEEFFESLLGDNGFNGLTTKNTQMIFAQKQNPILSAKISPSGFWEFETLDYPGLVCELSGLAQEKNAATVLCAIDLIKNEFKKITSDSVYRGFRYVNEKTGLMGRWQIISQNPKIVFDVGHNEAGIKYVVHQLLSETYEKLHIVFGMVNDKDVSAVLELLPKNAIYYFTQANIPRALDVRLLADLAKKTGLQGEIFSTVSEAFLAAKHKATKKDFIFVGGSAYVVAEALAVTRDE